MKHLISFFLILGFSLTFLGMQPAFAQQTGSIEGLVVDAENGEAMIGVNVLVQGTSQGASTDMDGKFRIANVALGTYTVTTSMLGYARLTVNHVAVDASKVTTLNLQLHAEALQIHEVVVEATQVNNTEASLLGIQKRAPAVSDGISAEQIKRSPDADASAAVKRVSGVTVVGDKYVYVRGMGERYNNTRLNGVAIASPEPLKRTVPFDIIPANLLDNVIVSKTATPDQPGDFAGGTVQLNTREFPDKLIFSVSTTSAYNDQTTFKGFNSAPGGNKDWLAIDDGSRAIPGVAKGAGWWNDVSGQRQAAAGFSNTWEPHSVSAPLNASRSVSLGNQTEFLGRPLGYLMSLNYSDSYSRRQAEQYDYIPASDGAGRSWYNMTQALAVDRSVRTVGWGGILDLNTRLSDHHKLSVKTLYTRSADDEARLAEGWIKVANFRSYRMTWTERSLLNTQLKGVDDLPRLLNSRLDWSGSYSRGTYDQPDRRDLYYMQSQLDGQYYYTPSGISGRRKFSDMRDNVYEGSLDWTLPLEFLKLSTSKLKAGGLYRDMKRSFPTRTFYFTYETMPDQPQMDLTLSPDAIFSPRSVEQNFRLDELTAALDSYNARMKVAAGYLMGDIMLGPRWRFIGGVRVEDTDQHYKTYPYKGSLTADISEGGPKHTDVMPSLNATYKVSEKLNLRGAASMTIANPDYAEIVPSEDQEYFEGTVRVGNPKIKHSKIQNFDLRADLYPSPGENLSVGLFYKKITDPIEWVITSGTSQSNASPQNYANAKNMGGELEFRKSLDLLAPRLGEWISFFSLIGNVTVLSSDVDLTSGKGILTNSHRPLMEQSKYVVNGTIAFDQPVWGSSIRVLYNTFGKRISAVGAGGLDDTYEMPFSKFDVTCNQKLDSHWGLKFQGVNLLNSTVEFQSRGYVVQKYKVGRTFSAGLSYAL